MLRLRHAGADRPLGVVRDVGNECVGRKSVLVKIRKSRKYMNLIV